MKKIDVFIDLEGIGMPQGIKRNILKIQEVGDNLRLALLREGYELRSVAGFARYKHPRNPINPRIREALSNAFKANGWSLTWSAEIADEALIAAVRNMIRDCTLAESILLIANDHDFIKLVRDIKNSGRFVMVAGPAVSKRLQIAADCAKKLWDFLEEYPDVSQSKGIKNDEGKSFNPIPL